MDDHTSQPDNWRQDIAPFQKSDIKKSLWQITNTLVPFLGLWVLAYISLSVSYWLTLAFTVLAAGFLVRIFIIFHDCCHHSFFKSRKANVTVGVIMGLLTFFPYDQWKYDHWVHHASNSNLNRRGTGDIWMLTTNEYLASSPFRRLVYRVYRSPIVMFGIGPIYLFLIGYRYNRKRAGRKERFNTHATTLTLAIVIAALCWVLGWREFLMVQVPILYISGVVGIWLFYVQHQFGDTYFENTENWDFVSAALQGSSLYKLPKVLQWITGNIGFHHIHHLGPKVPNYNLQRAHDSNPALQKVPVIGLLSSLRSLGYRVWDEDSKKCIGFRGIRLRKSAEG